MDETAHGQEAASVRALLNGQEAGEWLCRYRVDKWNRNEDFEAGLDPDEVLEGEGNLLVNAGIALLEDLLIGAGGSAFSTGVNATLGVGTSAAGADATETALDTEIDRKTATAVVTDQTVTFQATFNDDDSAGVWAEAGTFNALIAGTMLNHLVQAMGTKGAGATWVLTMNIVIS